MPSLTVRNLPDEVHRAIKIRAALHGCSMETEVRTLLESIVKSHDRVKLGALLFEIGREADLTDEEVNFLCRVRDSAPARMVNFE